MHYNTIIYGIIRLLYTQLLYSNECNAVIAAVSVFEFTSIPIVLFQIL